jgi:hypothetical protein
MKPRVVRFIALICVWAGSVLAVVESGVYEVVPGATVQERGDRVPNGIRIVPWSATLKFDLSSVPPSLTAFIPNAVLEGGSPFPLTVRSAQGYQLSNGVYSFSGDYLRDIYPSGTQYLFNWNFSPSTNGQVLWNGYVTWAGGHLWDITLSNIALVPQPWLTISRAGSLAVQLTWSTNFSKHGLEYATSWPAVAWNSVTNPVSNAGGRLSVTVEKEVASRFYRLRRP